MHRVLSFLMAMVTAVAVSAQTFAADSLRVRVDRLGPVPVEGVWQFTGEGATVLVERVSGRPAPDALPAAYNMIMISPVDDTVRPGTHIGRLQLTAVADAFDCRLYIDPSAPEKGEHRFTLRLNDAGHFSFLREKGGVSVSLWRWIPYLFRVTVVRRNVRDPRLDGAVKIYPVTPSTFNSPRYL